MNYSRAIFLISDDVRIERVQDISEEDARAEGVDDLLGFIALWDDINGVRAPWILNPWVVTVTFTAARQNIDRIKEAA